MEQVTRKQLILKSGYSMPMVGLGTWQLASQHAEQIVSEALDIGYRHIDTAEAYGNEEAIGSAIRAGDRTSIFITSKVEPEHGDTKGVIEACERSLDRLRTDYLDLYLLHWPAGTIPTKETMEGMAWLIENRMIRSAGLSNFDVAGLRKAMTISDVPICNNQIEYHPLRNRDDILAFCRDQAISLTAYSPLARGEVFTVEVIREIAHRYGKSPAQVSLRWLLQMGAAVIPKAGSTEHLMANFDLDDFELSSEEVRRIHELGVERRLIDINA